MSAAPSSVLPEPLRSWRAARSSHRAVALRNGAIVLSEWRNFEHFEATYPTPEAARWAIAAGDVDWKPAKRSNAAHSWR